DEGAGEGEVVDRVVRDLEAGEALHEGPVIPRRAEAEAHLGVSDLAEKAAADRLAEREHVRGEAELEVDGGSELALAADRDDAAGLGEIAAEGLLDQDG